MRISDWSSDVCSSDLLVAGVSEVEARRLALVSAQSAYDASQVGLEVGTRTVIDVLINQQNLFDAQRQYRSEEHTSELQSLMRISYAVFCLKTKKNNCKKRHNNTTQAPGIQTNKGTKKI